MLIPWNLLAEKLIQKIFRLPDTLLADAGQILRFRAVAIQDMGHIDGNLIGSRAMRHKLKHAVVDRHRTRPALPDSADLHVIRHPRKINSTDHENQRGRLHLAVRLAPFLIRTPRHHCKITVTGCVHEQLRLHHGDPAFAGDCGMGNFSVRNDGADQLRIQMQVYSVKINQFQQKSGQRRGSHVDIASAALFKRSMSELIILSAFFCIA